MLFGHSDKVGIFKRLVNKGNLSHAYLFYGDPQIGKFHFSKLLAFFLEYGKFELLDTYLIDTKIFLPNENNVIGIETVREIKRFLSHKPFNSPRRLAILNDTHALTREAESSMLKIVEEPPQSAMIIFIAHDLQVLFAPLLSRLVRVYFSRFSKDAIKEILFKNYKVSMDRSLKIAEQSFGRIGRALDLLEVKKGISDENDLGADIGAAIVDLYSRDVRTHSGLLAKLLDRETKISRFNLNANLQRKAIQYESSSQ